MINQRRLVRTYQMRFPNVFLMVEQGVADLSEMLVTNQVDVALLYGKPLSPMIELTPLIDHELGLVYPKAWKKRGPAGRPIPERLSLREMAGLPVIVPSASQGMRLLIEQAYHDAGIRPNIVMEVNGHALTRSLVRDGVGAMFLARTGLRGAADTAAFGFAHIRDPVISWTHWLTTGLPLVIAAPLLGLLLNLDPAATGAVALTLLAGTPALTFIGLIGAALTVALRRGGLLLAVLILPLTIPVLIFGVAASNAAIVGPVPFGAPFSILCALTLMSAGGRPPGGRHRAAAKPGMTRCWNE